MPFARSFQLHTRDRNYKSEAKCERRVGCEHGSPNFFQQPSIFEPHPPDDQARLRADLVKMSKAYGRTKIERSCLLPCHIEALNKLKRNPDVMLLRPDKGSGVIVMDRANNLRKFEGIFSNNDKFLIDKKQEDASGKVTTSLSKLLNKLKTRGVISPEQHRRLLPQGASPPRMYGLPKVHKDGCHVRPIVSMTRSAYEIHRRL
jgi:hypothetical protein